MLSTTVTSRPWITSWVSAPASPATRAMMWPTVRQEIRVSFAIVVFEHAAGSQATWSSEVVADVPRCALGNNSSDGITGFSAAPGWDAASGLGTPHATDLADALAHTTP